MLRDITTRLKIADQAAVKVARANPGITIHNWSSDERKKFRAIARTQWKAAAKSSPNAKKVYDTLTKYLEDNGLL